MTRNPFADLRQPPRAPDMSNATRIRDAINRDGWVMRRSVDLRKIREGLGLKLQYVAALASINDMTLQRCEEKQDDPEMVEQILAVLALYMATRWGADILNLTEANLEGTN